MPVYEAVNRCDLNGYRPYYMQLDSLWYRVTWRGTCGYFDGIPIEKWHWETGPRKGQDQESYSVIFHTKDDSLDTTEGYVNGGTYRLEYLAPWGWESHGKYLGKVVGRKLRKFKRQFTIQYEWRATREVDET